MTCTKDMITWYVRARVETFCHAPNQGLFLLGKPLVHLCLPFSARSSFFCHGVDKRRWDQSRKAAFNLVKRLSSLAKWWCITSWKKGTAVLNSNAKTLNCCLAFLVAMFFLLSYIYLECDLHIFRGCWNGLQPIMQMTSFVQWGHLMVIIVIICFLIRLN